MECDENDGVVFIKSKRYKELLLLGGYKYTFQRNNKSGTSNWRCERRDICNASITLNPTRNKGIREPNHASHCKPNYSNMEILKCLDNCKKRCSEEYGPIEPIFDESMQPLLDRGMNLVEKVPSFIEKKKTGLYNIRKRKGKIEKLLFRCLKDVNLPQKLQKYLFCDFDDKENGKRLLIYVSPTAAKMFQRAKLILGDGTFKVVKKPFSQLYTLHADLGSTRNRKIIVPLAFAILPDKSQETYTTFLTILKEKLPLWNPTFFKIDFEIAMYKAIKATFPDAKISGCSFHYSEAIKRKTKKLKLKKHKFVTLCKSLAQLPPQLIPEGWLSVQSLIPDTANGQKFVDYFISQWMSNNVFSTFSCFNERHPTINNVEGWHNLLNRRIPKKANIFNLIDGIQKIIAKGDLKIRKIKLNMPVQNKRTHKDIKITKSRNDIIKSCLAQKCSVLTCLKRLTRLFHTYDVRP